MENGKNFYKRVVKETHTTRMLGTDRVNSVTMDLLMGSVATAAERGQGSISILLEDWQYLTVKVMFERMGFTVEEKGRGGRNTVNFVIRWAPDWEKE